jgi:hypothetical protein
VSEFLNLYTIVAFLLGVALSAMVKGLVSNAKSKL